MSILLLGKDGQLGWELCRALVNLGPVLALDYPDIDFTHPASIRSLVVEHKPDVIINAVGYTDVDKAEGEPELVNLVNAITPGELAVEAQKLGALLIHYSTDFVFDGTKGAPYIETDTPHPINVYAESKLAGERFIQQAGGTHLIIRTSSLYSLRRNNFLLKVLQWFRSYEVVQVVDDLISNPTSAPELAKITAQCLELWNSPGKDWFAERTGIYHLGGDGWASRYEWAKSILEADFRPQDWKVKQLVAVKSDAFPAQALRPGNTSMSCEHFYSVFGLRLPHWRQAVRQILASWTPNG